MQPKSSQHQSGELFRPRLDEQINLRHPLVKKLDGSVHFNDLAHILFDQALLAEGGALGDPSGFVRRLNDMLLGMASK